MMQNRKWTEFVRDMRAEAASVFGTRLTKRDRLTLDDEDEEQAIVKIRGFSTASEPVRHCVPARAQQDIDPTIYVEAVEKQLDNMYKMGTKIVRQFGQVTFHTEIIKILLPVIFGNKWNQYKDMMKVRYKIDREYQTCFIMSSRQVGKTEGISMLVAALAAHVPNIKIAVFAQTEATAQALTGRVYQYLLNIPGIEARITAHNMSGVTLTFHSADQRKVVCYALTEGARGFSVPVVIVDEMAFVGEKPLKETVYPVLRNSPSALIGCSTPEGPDNFFSALINAKDVNGQPLHKFVNLSLICEACMQLPEDERRCTHMNHMRVEWHSTKGDALITSLIGSASTAARELAGVPISRDSARFSRTYVLNTLIKNARVDVTDELFTRAFITCDPSGGGESDLAFWAGVWHKGYTVTLALAAFSNHNGPLESEALTRQFVLALMERFTCLRKAKILFIPERIDFGVTHAFMVSMRTFPFVHTVRYEDSRKYGVPKTYSTTLEMCNSIDAAMETGTARFATNLLTMSNHRTSERLENCLCSNDYLLKKMEEQLLRFYFVPTQKDSNGNVKRYTLTGKQGPTLPDDLAIAWIMGHHWPNLLLEYMNNLL